MLLDDRAQISIVVISDTTRPDPLVKRIFTLCTLFLILPLTCFASSIKNSDEIFLKSDSADIYFRHHEYEKARVLYRECFNALSKKGLAIESAEIKQKIAKLEKELGNFKEAERAYRGVVQIVEIFLGPRHVGVASSLDDLATFLKEMKRDTEANRITARANKIRNAAEMFGKGDKLYEFIWTQDDLADFYLRRKDYKRVVEICNKSLAMLSDQLEESFYNDKAHFMNKLAESYKAVGEYTEAERQYRGIIELYEKYLGPNHEAVAGNLERLATVLVELKRDTEAKEINAKARTIRERGRAKD